jgi:hypothetical protein
MADHNRSTAIVLAMPSKRGGASAPQKIVRMAVPMLFAAMGVSMGTLAGVATAFVSVPMASAASVDNGNSGTVQMAALVTPGDHGNAGNSNGNDSAAAQPAVEDSSAHRATQMDQAPGVERARSKTPSVDKTATPASAPSETHPAKRLAHPVNRPLRTEMATEPEVAPIEMDADQSIPVEEAKSSGFVSEGDLTVADYNPDQGTIETSDGRTFELGETVSMGQTVAWDQYRSNVHYRCEQDGNCTLQRAGAVTINSKQI